ncbi:MAG: ATP-binding protein [Chloroflexi bacterium]|nr:ATP-binding protein [Chloroflexota bacterium]
MKNNPSHAHLSAEYRRIDLLIQRQVRRLQIAGYDPAETFRGLFVTDEKAEQLAARSFAANWSHSVQLPEGEDHAFEQSLAEATNDIESHLLQADTDGRVLRLVHLAEVLGLDRFDLDTLLIAMAPAFDTRYERLYGFLQDDVTRRRAGVSLVLDATCGPDDDRLAYLARFTDDHPLFRHKVLTRVVEPPATTAPMLGQSLVPDESVVGWVLGHYHPGPALGALAEVQWCEHAPLDELLADDTLPLINAALAEQTVIAFSGPDRARQDASARLFAVGRGQPLLRVDLAGAGETPVLDLVRTTLRDAALLAAVPVFIGWDSTFSDGHPRADILNELARFPAAVILCSHAAWQARGVERDRHWIWLDFPLPDYPHRRALWTHTLDHIAPGAGLDTAGLAGQFNLTAGQIRDAVMSAHDIATQRRSPLTMDDLFASARMHSSPGLTGQARKIRPRFTWSDIVLPDEQSAVLREIIATVRGRPQVLGEWGLGRKLTASEGVAVLFAGPPGTGKTMAAEVIASELGLDLYKIELSSLVSKYIGETEKNLERIFIEAETSNAILFFDEADAIFGKRSEVKDAHDRYANIEISYLLQRMEGYDGVTILATNLRANLDEAFTRRLQFAIDFPFPDDAYRLRIWQTLFPSSVPRSADVDFEVLARRFRLSGGSIRNIIVSAAFLASGAGGVVTMDHLLHGTRRELQKMGRLLREGDLQTSQT